MNKNILTITTLILIAGVGYNYSSINSLKNSSNKEVSATINTETSIDIENLLMENPEAIINSLEAHKEKMMAEQEKMTKDQIIKNYDKIYSENSFIIGNPDAEIKMVEFFDYNCGYCKTVAKELTKLVAENPNVQVYLKDAPILGENSLEAAKAAIAAGLLGKYKEYNTGLMTHKGKFDEKAFRKIAKDVGLDDNALIEMTSSKRVSEILMENRQAANLVGLQGTPTIFIGTEQYFGALNKEAMEIEIRKAMEKNIK